jgi:hypothetical protein
MIYLYDNQKLNIYKYDIFINAIGTLENIGIELFVFAALKEHLLYLVLFFCLFTLLPASVTA